MHRFALSVLVAAAIAFSTGLPAIAAAPPGCTGAQAHQFDFWVGNWNVYDVARKQLQGTNKVTLEFGTCVVHEHWKGTSGDIGESLNFYYPDTKRWHQTWVSNSGYLFLDGGMRGDTMVLTGHRIGLKGRTITDRIVYTPGSDGSVRQTWDASVDGGKTWKNVFDGVYVKV